MSDPVLGGAIDGSADGGPSAPKRNPLLVRMRKGEALEVGGLRFCPGWHFRGGKAAVGEGVSGGEGTSARTTQNKRAAASFAGGSLEKQRPPM